MYPGYQAPPSTLVTGQPPPAYNPVGFIPGGPIAQMLAGGALGSLFGPNYTYMGQAGLSHHRNMQNMLFYHSHYRMVQQTAQRDVHMVQDTLRSLAIKNGIDVNSQAWKAQAAKDAKLLGIAVGMGAQSPELMDLLSGGRSATALAHGIGLAGRHRRDPVTGGWGMSEASAGMLASGLHAYYYDIGGRFGPRNRADMNARTMGLTSGQMGGLFDELTRRGLMDSGGSFRNRILEGLKFMEADTSESGGRRRLQAILDREGISGTDFNKLSDKQLHKLFEYGDVRQGMRSADVVRVKDKLDQYTGAIKAVQEIFGEAGRPDAPMPELFEQLQRFTMDSVQMLRPGKAEQMVREMQSVARRAGIGMDAMNYILASAGEQAQALGLEPVFATQATMSAMAFRQAYGDSNLGNTPAWGMVSADKLTMMHSQARMNAQKSQFTNRLGALARLEARGATLSDSAKELLRAARVGDMKALESMSNMSTSQFIAAMQGGDLSARDLQMALTHSEANDEFAFYENFGDVATEMMPRELANKVLGGDSGAFTSTARNKLTAMIGRNDGTLARAMADAAARELVLNMDVDTRHDANKRNAGMAAAMKQVLESAAANGDAGAAAMLARGDLDKQLSLFAEEMYANADTATGPGALVNLIDMNDPTVLARKRGMQQLGKVDSVISRMLSSKTGSASMMQRIFGAINAAGADGKAFDLKAVIAEGLGLSDTKDVSEGLLDSIRKVEDIRSRAISLIEESTGKSVNEMSAAEIQESLNNLPEVMQALGQVESELENAINENQDIKATVDKILEDERAAAEGGTSATAANAEGGVSVDRLALQASQIVFNGKIVMENASGEADVSAQDSPKGPANTAVS